MHPSILSYVRRVKPSTSKRGAAAREGSETPSNWKQQPILVIRGGGKKEEECNK